MTKSSGYTWRCNVAAIQEALPQLGACVNVPEPPRLHFIQGSESIYFTDADAQAVQRMYPSAQLHVVQGADHWVHVSQPATFMSTVLHILGQHERA